MNLRHFFSLLFKIPTAIFGRWTPPLWLRGLGRLTTKRPRVLVAALCVMIGLGFGGREWWLWREAHKPRPRELVAVRPISAKAEVPAIGWNKDTKGPDITPLVVSFDADAAPLEAIQKDGMARAACIAPATPGAWKWIGARSLRFTPEKPWPAGTLYKVTIDPAGLAPNTENKVPAVEFTTHKLTARFQAETFDTSPDEPGVHKAVGSVSFNYPVALETVEKAISVTATGGGGIFVTGSAMEVEQSSDSLFVFHVHSPRITIPENEDFVRFAISRDVTAMAGGASLGTEVVTKIKVPTRTSGFNLTSAKLQIVSAEDGEPRQHLFLESSAWIEPGIISKALSLWTLPSRDEQWTTADVTPDVLKTATQVKAELVEEEESPKHAKHFVFRLPPLAHGTLFFRVAAGTPAVGGFELGAAFETPIAVPAYPKEARIVGEGGILALNGDRKLSIKSRGYEHLRFTLGRVPAGQINHLVSQTGGEFQAPEFRGSFGQDDIARFHRQTQHIAKRNDHEASYSAFDFAALLAGADTSDPEPSRGLFFIEIEGARKHTGEDKEADKDDPDPDWVVLDAQGEDVKFDDEEDNGAADRRFLLVTDLGLLVKRNADGSRDVFVQSFKSRDPVAAVRITALAKNGESLLEIETDTQGHAAIPALDGLKRERKAVAIVARKGSDLAFIPWERSDRKLELTRFDIEGIPQSEATALDAFVFTERGIFRPGDSIHVAAIVRQRDWKGSLAGIPVELTVTNAKEEEAGTFPAKLTADGFVEFEVPTIETAPTGVWRLDLRRAGVEKNKRGDDEEEEQRHLGHTVIRVEDFQPDRMKMTAKLDPASSAGWQKPGEVSAQVDVQTLFGIAAVDRRVTGSMTLRASAPNFEAWPGWRFHLPNDDHFEERTVELTTQKTDTEGHVKFPLSLGSYSAPLLSVGVNFEAFEPDGGRGVRGTVSTLISLRDRLIGCKADGDLNFIGRDVPAKLRIVAVGPDLRAVAAPALMRKLIETRHISVLTKQDNGTFAYVSREKDRETESVAVDLPAGESELMLPTGKAGRFRYEWRDGDDNVLCVQPFVVVGPGEPGRNLERDSELEVTMPARELRPGDPLEVALRAPFAGGGLMTVERERVLGWQWFKTDSSSSVQKMTIPAGLEGSAFVNVALVRGLDSPEIFTNPLTVGVAPFRVATDARKLGVTLDVPERVKPGESLKIGYRCERKSRVVIWAVDEGIHRVTNYRLPDPLALFFRQRSLEVGTWQLMDLLLPEFSILKQSKAYGGDGDSVALNLGMNPFKRRKAAPVVFWSGIIEGGPERREVRYDVPDYFAGRLNIMATAVALDVVGTAQAQTIVKGSFVLTPNAPFFIAPGDEFIASLTVANQMEGADASDAVTIAAESLGALEILEAPKSPLTIALNTETTVRFRVRAKTTLGNAELKFAASAGNQKVEVRSTMSVRPTTPFTTEIQSGWFRLATHEVRAGRALMPEFARREAVASTTPLGLNRGLEAYLDAYPHGCSEQITSKAFPWLAAEDRVRAKEAVGRAIAQLARRQGPDGGFGYWTSGEVGGGLDYVTLYVGHFLTEAKAAEFQVPPSMLDGMMKRLKVMAAIPKAATRHDASLQAAAIYLLTRHGVVTTNYALNLRDSLGQISKDAWLPDNSTAWLAATWRLLKKDDEAKKLIAAHWKAIRSGNVSADANYFYESQLTQSAQSFVVICRHFPEIAGTFGYDDLRLITEPISDGRFHTLGAAWSVLALRSYAALAKDSGIKVAIKNVAPAALGMASGKIPSTVASLHFNIDRPAGAQDLGAWYQVLEAGYDKSPPVMADTKGLEVSRELLGADGKPFVSARVGDTLRLRVRVRNVNSRAQTHIAVNELFPGGFDLAPDGLKPGLHAVPGTEYVDVREDRALFFTSLGAGESRVFDYAVRPTCAGTFAIPPAFAENMYDRAIHGSGVGGSITIAPRE